eukprot:CAMPEP_0202802596 /NCGR_PEP_ID=MMETSP1388-20130828/102718_1 /ASSEMBLY_ACC=CAM_ASM_000864 /TAXON_ID=37098 /ORGANISM="Isochrysis sp, Strain CCMP1244" /LENGTH=418 /DNA_ID=CAMNT_0049472587 /DNA_START=23 /DNA_END=1276 /DNA_ORIENTATION=-
MALPGRCFRFQAESCGMHPDRSLCPFCGAPKRGHVCRWAWPVRSKPVPAATPGVQPRGGSARIQLSQQLCSPPDAPDSDSYSAESREGPAAEGGPSVGERVLRRVKGHGVVRAAVRLYLPPGDAEDEPALWRIEHQRLLRRFEGHEDIGAVVRLYLPPGEAEDEPALWRIEHDDGDEEELEEYEVLEAMRRCGGRGGGGGDGGDGGGERLEEGEGTGEAPVLQNPYNPHAKASHHEIRAGAVVRVWWTPSMLRIGSNQAAARGSGRFERGTVMHCDPPELARRGGGLTVRFDVFYAQDGRTFPHTLDENHVEILAEAPPSASAPPALHSERTRHSAATSEAATSSHLVLEGEEGGEGEAPVATEAEGLRLHLSRRASTGYKGVCLQKGRFRASCTRDGRSLFLGYFDSAVEAAVAYAL